MPEIIPTQPLCWVIDAEGNKYYKECTLESLQNARDKKLDIRVGDNIFFDKEGKEYKNPGEEILTHFQISKYGKADTVDIFIYFSLPKYPKIIKDRFKISVSNMTKDRRRDLSYEAIKNTIEGWIKEDNYYS